MVEGSRAVDLLYLIDRLEEMIAEGRRMPLGGGLVLDRRRILDVIDQMRVAVPAAIREAQDLLQRREELLERAEEEARRSLADAKDRVGELVASHEIARQAEERSRAMVGDARRRAEALLAEAERQVEDRMREVRLTAEAQMAEADRYALELLQRLEAQLGAFSGSVRSAIDTISSQPAVEAAEPELTVDDDGYDEDYEESEERDYPESPPPRGEM